MPIIVDPVLGTDTGIAPYAITLNAADNLADLCVFEYAGDSIDRNTKARVEVRQLMNRRRLVRRGTDAYESLSIGLVRCTPTQVAWLVAHVGTLVCIRDHVGGKVYAVYDEVPREISTAYRDRTDVKLALDEVTHSEAV